MSPLAKQVFTILSMHHQNKTNLSIETSLWPQQPSLVFLSYTDGQQQARVSLGSGKDIPTAIQQALRHSRMDGLSALTVVKIDVVSEVKTLDKFEAAQFKDGEEGIAFSPVERMVLLPEQVAVNHILQHHAQANPHVKRIFQRLAKVSSPVYFFKTQSFIVSKEEFHSLNEVHHVRATETTLKQATLSAIEYAKNNIQANGDMIDRYHPETNQIYQNNDLIYHTKMVSTLLDAYELTRDDELLNKTKQSISYLVSFAKPCTQGEYDILCIHHPKPNDTKLDNLAADVLNQYFRLSHDGQYRHIAMKLAKDSNEGEIELTEVSSNQDLQSILNRQYQISNTLYFRYPNKAVGAFRKDQNNLEITLATLQTNLANLIQNINDTMP